MNSQQIASLIKHGLIVTSIQTDYELRTHLNLNNIRSKCKEYLIRYVDNCKNIENTFIHYMTVYIEHNNIIYHIDLYKNGRLTIYEAIDSSLILELIFKIITLFDINIKRTLDVNNLRITVFQCKRSIGYNINIDQIIPNKFYKSKDIKNRHLEIIGVHYTFSRRKFGNVIIHPRKEITINSLSYLHTIYIYEHINACTILPIVLHLLNNRSNSFLNMFPKEIIEIITKYAQIS